MVGAASQSRFPSRHYQPQSAFWFKSRCSQTSWVTAGGKLFEQFPGERDKPRMLAEIENKIATSIGGFRERRDEWG
jgi:hypothetical protein